jgi:uncharacterized membrane protein YidH (DUF202 family)
MNLRTLFWIRSAFAFVSFVMSVAIIVVAAHAHASRFVAFVLSSICLLATLAQAPWGLVMLRMHRKVLKDFHPSE